jgi:adenosylcobinamide-GDP ribazoletransferase
MNVLRSIVVAFSMFSRIPTPRVEWEAKNMRYALAALPLVGCVIGGVLFGWGWLSGRLSFGAPLFAAGMTLLPLLITGGIHMDGFCDTVDALSSHAPPERKREILKDSHVGAFALIATGGYLLAYFALSTELMRDWKNLLSACLIPVAARAVSGFVSICSSADGSGLLHAMRGAARHTVAGIALLAWFVSSAAATVAVSPVAGTGMTAAAVVCAGTVYRMSKKEFGGMSGDISGYLLRVTELSMLAVLVFIQKAVNVV